MSTMRVVVVIVGLAMMAGSQVAEAQERGWERMLRIGVADGPVEYTLGRVIGVAYLRSGDIAVLDALPPRLLLYSRDGTFLRVVGTEGAGPGEFKRPVALALNDSTMSVYDGALRRLVTFSPDGRHIATIPFAREGTPLSDLVGLGEGRWLAQTGFDPRMLAGIGGRERDIEGQLLLFDGSAVDTVSSFDSGALAWFDKSGGSFGLYRRSFGYSLLVAASGDSLAATIDSRTGDIRWWKGTADGLLSVGRRSLGLETTRLDLKAIEDSLTTAHRDRSVVFVGPRYERRFSEAVMDEAGRLWLHVKRDEKGSNSYFVVPMDQEPSPVSMQLPEGFSPRSFSDGLVAGVGVDELGINYVDVYRVPEVFIEGAGGVRD